MCSHLATAQKFPHSNDCRNCPHLSVIAHIILVIIFVLSVPGPPSSIYFPDVSEHSARIVWSPPLQPNGIILGYRVAYREKSRPPSYTIVDDTLSQNTLEYNVTGLERTTYYVFSLTARTNSGWGITEDQEVYTINNRRKCQYYAIH